MKKTPFLFPKILGILFAVSVITACPELPEFVIKTVDLKNIGKEVPPGGYTVNLTYYVAQPVTDGFPAKSIDNDKFSGKIVWTPVLESNGFTQKVKYTATVILTAKTGFTFADDTEYTHEVADHVEYKSGKGKEVKVEIFFPETAEKPLDIKGQDYVAWADNPGGTSQNIYFYFSSPVILDERNQVKITRSTGGLTRSSYPVVNQDGYMLSQDSGTTWFLSFANNGVSVDTAGTVDVHIDTPDNSVKSSTKTVWVHKSGGPQPTQAITGGNLGITPPEAGEKPDIKVYTGTQYARGPIQWYNVTNSSSHDEKTSFAYDTTYRADFTLYAMSNYVFTSITRNWSNIDGNPDSIDETMSKTATSLGMEVTFHTGSPVAVTGVSLTPTALNLVASGATGTLTATITPSDPTDKSVTWVSDNTSVATVNGTGLTVTVSPVAVGTANITVTTTDGNYQATCAVTVTAAARILDSITVTNPPTKTTYIAGDNFNTTGLTVDANYSNAPSVAVTTYTTSPANGTKLTATGTAVPVTVTYTEGGVIKNATFTITVKPSVAVTVGSAATVYAEVTESTGATVTGITDGYQVVINNYGPYAWFKVNLGAGKTISDFSEVKLDYAGIQGDIGYKTVYLLVSDNPFPADLNAGSPSAYLALRVSGSFWGKDVAAETVTSVIGKCEEDDNPNPPKIVDVTGGVNASTASEVYVSVYLHASGTGTHGGAGSATTYSVANMVFVPKTGTLSNDAAINSITVGGQSVTQTGTIFAAVTPVTVTLSSLSGVTLSFTKSNANSTQAYTVAAAKPADGDSINTTANPTSTAITISDGQTIWIKSLAQDGTTALYYAVKVELATASGSATITFTVKDLGNMDIYESGQTISKTETPPYSKTLKLLADLSGITTFNPPGDTVNWRVGGFNQVEGTDEGGGIYSFTINAADYTPGRHNVILVIKVDGIHYSSQPAFFDVTN
jgi:hypothetical protein